MRFVLCAVLMTGPAFAATCESLAGLKLANTTITGAQSVAAGTFTPPGAPPSAPALTVYKTLPAFCRVRGVIQPSNDSHIEFEVAAGVGLERRILGCWRWRLRGEHQLHSRGGGVCQRSRPGRGVGRRLRGFLH
jgi:hypothetical protein